MNFASELSEYSHNIKGNITGGLTAGVVALPLCLAFGIASGLGAASGLYGAICLSFFAAIFGGTKTQISGPTGPMTVVTASVVVAVGGNHALIASVFLVAGLFQILFGVLRLGKFIRYIPYSVISGFMSGVGVIIILLQLSPLFGGPNPKGPVDGLLIFSSFSINGASAVLGFAALAIIYLTPKKINAIIPAPLLALIILTAVSYGMHLNVPVIGTVPSGLPATHVPHITVAHLGTILTYGFVLAVLGCIDSLLTSLVADSMTKTKHDSNRELVGQGIGNALCGFVCGNVGAGATMRTVTNIKLGGTGRLSGVVSSLFLVAVLVSLYNVVCFVPLSVLAGILVSVGINILDYRLLKEVKLCPSKADTVIMVVVFLLTVFVDLIFAVGIGVVLALLSLVFVADSEMKQRCSGVNFWRAITLIYQINQVTRLDVRDVDSIKVCSVLGGFYFGASSALASDFSAVTASKYILDLSQVTFTDVSGVYAFEDEIGIKHDAGATVYLVALPEQHLMNFRKKVGEDKVFTNIEEALAAAK